MTCKCVIKYTHTDVICPYEDLCTGILVNRKGYRDMSDNEYYMVYDENNEMRLCGMMSHYGWYDYDEE